MTHEEMIQKLEVGMVLDAGAMKSKIVAIETKCEGLLEITNEQGQKVGSMQLHDLVYNRQVIKIEGME